MLNAEYYNLHQAKMYCWIGVLGCNSLSSVFLINWQLSVYFNTLYTSNTLTDVSREPLSAAERQRRYRARRDADPKRRAKYLK